MRQCWCGSTEWVTRCADQRVCMACATVWRDQAESVPEDSVRPEVDARPIALLDLLLDFCVAGRVAVHGEGEELAELLTGLGFDLVEGEAADAVVATVPMGAWPEPKQSLEQLANRLDAGGVLLAWVALEDSSDGWGFRADGLHELFRGVGFGYLTMRSALQSGPAGKALTLVIASRRPLVELVAEDRDSACARCPSTRARLLEWRRSVARERQWAQRADRAEQLARSATTGQLAKAESHRVLARRYRDLVEAVAALRQSGPYRAMVRVGPWQRLDSRLAWHQSDAVERRVESVRRVPSGAGRSRWTPEVESNTTTSETEARPLTVAIDWLFPCVTGVGESVRWAQAWTRALAEHGDGVRIVVLVHEALDRAGVVPEFSGSSERIVTTPANWLRGCRHQLCGAARFDVVLHPLGAPAFRIPGATTAAALSLHPVSAGASDSQNADVWIVPFGSVASRVDGAIAAPRIEWNPGRVPEDVATARLAELGLRSGAFVSSPLDLSEETDWQALLMAISRLVARKPEAHFVLLGSDAAAGSQCSEAVRVMGLAASVLVIAEPTPQDRAILLQHCRAVVGPSASGALDLGSASATGKPVWCASALPAELGERRFDPRLPASIEAVLAAASDAAPESGSGREFAASSAREGAATLLDQLRRAHDARRAHVGLVGYRFGCAVPAFSVQCPEAGSLELVVRNHAAVPSLLHLVWAGQEHTAELAPAGCAAFDLELAEAGVLHVLVISPGDALGSVLVEGCRFVAGGETTDWLAESS